MKNSHSYAIMTLWNLYLTRGGGFLETGQLQKLYSIRPDGLSGADRSAAGGLCAPKHPGCQPDDFQCLPDSAPYFLWPHHGIFAAAHSPPRA